jgi:hypothetical protein
VAFAAVAPKVVVVNGKPNDDPAEPLKHTPFIEKHPPAKSIPRAKVEVAAVPVTLRYAVESPAVRVDVAGPVTYKDEVVAYDAKSRVLEAVVAKNDVVVAFVVVALMPVKFWSVDEPVARKLLRKATPETVTAVDEAYGNEEAARVEVAVKMRPVICPAITASPVTESGVPGDDVAIPTSPAESIIMRSVPPAVVVAEAVWNPMRVAA